MEGVAFVPVSAESHHHGGGLAASQQVLSLVVALFCFVIAAGFLLSLVPDPRRRSVRDVPDEAGRSFAETETMAADAFAPALGRVTAAGQRVISAPLGGLGQPPRAAPVARLPVEGADGTHFIDTSDVRTVRADAHYTPVHDGTPERVC